MSEQIEILFEDDALIVCVKPAGLVSEVGGGETRSLPDALTSQLAREGRAVTLYPVHRLDREVGGVMVYAKTSACAAHLSRGVSEGTFDKRYMAVLCGVPETGQGLLRDLLYHDRQKNKTYVVKRERRGVREAVLEYRVLGARGGLSLADIKLHTGRTHQIRAQFASRKLPLHGDTRYGGVRGERMALWAYRLCFEHPSGKRAEFLKLPPTAAPFDIFKAEIDIFRNGI
ncbi:MAG: RluA family pseudouridine synthase [Clostridia bacterium]|nr:RluA family pseudouridine synthase [Clostridia bacterium]